MKKYESYKETSIPNLVKELPIHWKSCKMNYLVEVKDGTHDSPSYVDESAYTYPLVTSKDLVSGNLDFYKCKFIKEEDHFNIIKRSDVSKGDILMPMIGSVGSPVIVKTNREFSIKNVALFKTSNNEEINTSYLNYLLSSDFIERQFDLNSNGGVQNFVSLSVLRKLNIFSLPLKEQTKIANYLDHKTTIIDALIDKKEQLIKKLQAQRQAIINELVCKGLDKNAKMKNSGIEWFGEIPEHWKVVKLKYISDVSFSSVDRHQYKDELKVNICHYPDAYKNDKILPETKLSEGTCTFSEYEKYQLKKGQVIITKDSESADDIGVPTFVTQTFQNTVCGYHLAILSTYENQLKGEYLFRFLQTDIVKSFFETNANGVTRFGLGKPTIENLYVPKLEIEEQNKIVYQINLKADKIDSTIIQVKTVIQKLKSYRQSIISEAVTGKIDLRDWQISEKKV
ncbi:restriction endonuclease subunit S [Polaribacter sp. SA4-12]|uniref:restriction endonuclease subunit S n=1 Tax=Polaribacter sp. SA4-12 TaxID=1312072 RepID=UPI000B3C7DAF|nr:restriction endonuclease subunit S [Polaribacter sp. SA4-12]ARV14823.1 hypothetical protein BTO07_06510 [Polaribacter sp. SA4-12]